MLKRSKTTDIYGTHRNKQAARSKIITAIAALLTLTLVSSAYAASQGWISFGGTVARTHNMGIRFVNASFAGTPRAGETIIIPAAEDYKRLSIATALIMPGDSRVVHFQIQNTGNQAVRILGIATYQDDRYSTGLHIEWPDDIATSPNLTNYVIIPDSMSSVFTMRINWDLNATNVLSSVIRSFSLTINYQDATLPLSTIRDIKSPLRSTELI
jgi:hypothetical protein